MGRYLFQASYSVEGVKGVLKEGGTGRRTAVEAAVKSLGGKLEGFYYAFGDTDVFVIVDGIDNTTAAAFSMGVVQTGALHSIKTTVLMTPEEIDAAGKKTMSYRPPGR
ncbi:MAG: GYD domain protein [Actinobacteria bacterium 13_1_20CM_2_65_11]|nr:MAG: GYD domain protein [Actinobacteria bacterium 13_1_40CM_4_65_12]OLD24150.1 MAG: GYD domain protein [Chloroflexi bacterium 13_1_40CM_3_65_12]OLD48395.1 MAG: GYD domain protein [Actinobacteria bacterium 13_1_40CM_2_65_8]OLE80897.1 MAG: GYD domain protein [Actinobacteria bacterium 13_1_20CM_2_65_11]